MKWMHWGLIGWSLLSSGSFAGAEMLPMARLTLQSPKPVPSLAEQEFHQELQDILAPSYVFAANAVPPSARSVAFFVQVEEQARGWRVRLSRRDATSSVLYTMMCEQPCTAERRTETARTLVAFVEPTATALLAPKRPEPSPIARLEPAPRPASPAPAPEPQALAETPPEAQPAPAEQTADGATALVAQEPLTPIEPSPLANEDSTESTAAEASATQEPPLSQFRRHLAERTYNRHIWQTLRNQLMFFRQENRNLRERALDPLRVQLQIDAQGKVVGQEILQTSREPIFDELVLTTAPNLRLAPPDASLVREPPYVVVVQISP